MENILNEYYKNNARKLHETVDKILLKFGGLSEKDKDDFYSLANEVFVDVIKRYDRIQSFEGFLYSCLFNRIKTEITRRNREKRKADMMSVSIDSVIGDDEDTTLKDVIAGSFDIEKELFEEKTEYSKSMRKYLDRLSDIQKKVLNLTVAGYFPNEIRKKLSLTDRQYADCYNAIHSYRNISVLL